MPVDSPFGSEEDYAYLKKLEDRIKNNPCDIDALIKKGFLCFDLFEDSEEAVLMFDQALRVDPNNVDVLFLLGLTHYIFFNVGKKAQLNFAKALRLDSNYTESRFFLSRVISDEDRELKFLKEVVKREPKWLSPCRALIRKLIRRNKLDEAEKLARETIDEFQEFELPTNASQMTKYFEYMVTGRTNYTKEEFCELLDKIEKLRKKDELKK